MLQSSHLGQKVAISFSLESFCAEEWLGEWVEGRVWWANIFHTVCWECVTCDNYFIVCRITLHCALCIFLKSFVLNYISFNTGAQVEGLHHVSLQPGGKDEASTAIFHGIRLKPGIHRSTYIYVLKIIIISTFYNCILLFKLPVASSWPTLSGLHTNIPIERIQWDIFWRMVMSSAAILVAQLYKICDENDDWMCLQLLHATYCYCSKY